jgi:hypothetical protein
MMLVHGNKFKFILYVIIIGSNNNNFYNTILYNINSIGYSSYSDEVSSLSVGVMSEGSQGFSRQFWVLLLSW